MQITETLNEGLKRELKVVIPADSLNSKLSERLQSMSKQARIKGFRPGKVPAEHLRKVYGRSVLAEIIQESVQQSAQKAVEDRGEKPALQPVINFSEDKDEIEAVMNGKADLAYTLEFEVIPQFDKPDYAKIKLEKKTTSASDADIDEALGKIVEQNQSFAPREAGAAAENGDRVTLDYSGKLDGRVFSGGTEEGAQLVLGSNTFIPGFEAQLVGKKPGDKTEVKVTFPENYQADFLAGKDVIFDVTVHEVAAPADTKIDDEFAKSLGVESLDKLKEALRERIDSDIAARSRELLKRDLLDVLDEQVKFDLPESLVDREFETIWKQVEDDLKRSGKTFEDEDTTEEEARTEYRTLSERRVRLGLLLAEIGQEAGVEVSDDELQRALIERVRQYPGQEQQVWEFFQKTPGAINEIRAPLFEEKVVDYIVERASVTEKPVSREELFHDHDHDHDHGEKKPAKKAAAKKAPAKRKAPAKKKES